MFSEETVARMLEKGLVRLDGESVVASVPIFHPADGDALQPAISAVVQDVVEQVYGGYPDDIYVVLDRLGFGFVGQDYPAYAHLLAQMGTVGALRRSGVLPEPPSPVPKGWGFFAWTGVFAPMEMSF